MLLSVLNSLPYAFTIQYTHLFIFITLRGRFSWALYSLGYGSSKRLLHGYNARKSELQVVTMPRTQICEPEAQCCLHTQAHSSNSPFLGRQIAN